MCEDKDEIQRRFFFLDYKFLESLVSWKYLAEYAIMYIWVSVDMRVSDIECILCALIFEPKMAIELKNSIGMKLTAREEGFWTIQEYSGYT